MERKMKIYPSRDDRHLGRGISSAKLVMFVKGERGVVAFTIYCGWYLPSIRGEGGKVDSHGVTIHSYERIGEEEEGNYGNETCDFLEGGRCYCSEYSLLGIRLLEILIKDGDEPVWKRLEEMYKSHLEG